MKKFTLTTFISLFTVFFASQQSFAYIFDLKILQQKDTLQTIICFSDRHQGYADNSVQQEAFIQHAHDTQGTVILEDLYYYDKENATVHKYLKEHKEEKALHFLVNLTEKLNLKNISVIPVEFRQEKVLSLYGQDIAAQEASNIHQKVLEEVSLYDDGPLFNACYTRIINDLKNKVTIPCKAFFKKFVTNTKNIKDCLANIRYHKNYGTALCYTLQKDKDYVQTLSQSEQMELLMLLFDYKLVDARIIHAIAQNSNKNPLYICAGARHIERVIPELESCGYTIVDHIIGDIELDDDVPAALDVEKALHKIEKYITTLSTTEQPKNYVPWMILFILGLLMAILYIVIKKHRTIIMPMILLCAANATYPHIFQVKIWENNGHSIFTFGDYHESHKEKNQINDQQKADIIELAKTYDATIIVEDIFPHNKTLLKNPLTYDPNGMYNFSEEIIKNLKADTVIPPIFGMVACCQKDNVSIINIEFRHANNASSLGKPISAHDTFLISQKIRDEICTYNDGEILNTHYQEVIADYDQCIANAQSLFTAVCRSKKGTIKNLLQRMKNNKGSDAVLRYLGWSNAHIKEACCREKNEYALNFYDLELIDLQILHHIYLNKEKLIFVCAGSLHIKNIEPALKKMGYTCTAHYGPEAAGPKEPHALDLKKTCTMCGKLVQIQHYDYPFITYLCLLFIFLLTSLRRITKRKNIVKTLN